MFLGVLFILWIVYVEYRIYKNHRNQKAILDIIERMTYMLLDLYMDKGKGQSDESSS